MQELAAALVAIVDELYDGVYAVDKDGRITFWNAGAERLTGYSASEVIGRRCSDGLLVHVSNCGEPMCSPTCPLNTALLAGRSNSAEVFALHRDGHRVPVVVRVAPIRDADGNVIGAVEAFSDNSAKIEADRRAKAMEHAAMVDHLTQLPNRRHLEQHIASRIAEVGRYGSCFGVLMLDIDHFKSINDTYGHGVGDAVLQMVAKTIGAATRATDTAGRWGGEEFVVVAAGVAAPGIALAGERFRALIESSALRHDDRGLSVTVSVGAVLGRRDDTVEGLLARCDRALYRAKELGRNRVVAEPVVTLLPGILAQPPAGLEAVAAAKVSASKVAAAEVGSAPEVVTTEIGSAEVSAA